LETVVTPFNVLTTVRYAVLYAARVATLVAGLHASRVKVVPLPYTGLGTSTDQYASSVQLCSRRREPGPPHVLNVKRPVPELTP
jgi:hypothetical protein